MLSISSWQIQNLPEIESSLREKETSPDAQWLVYSYLLLSNFVWGFFGVFFL